MVLLIPLFVVDFIFLTEPRFAIPSYLLVFSIQAVSKRFSSWLCGMPRGGGGEQLSAPASRQSLPLVGSYERVNILCEVSWACRLL